MNYEKTFKKMDKNLILDYAGSENFLSVEKVSRESLLLSQILEMQKRLKGRKLAVQETKVRE